MTPLPAWIEAIAKESGASRAEFTPKLVRVIAIMWEALERGKDLDCECGNAGECAKHYLVDAMRRVEEMGKGHV